MFEDSQRGGPSSPAAFRMLCSLLVLRAGGVMLHASAVVDGGRAHVFCGPSESGKKFSPSTFGIDFTPEPANVFGSSGTGFIVAVNYSGSTASALRMYTMTGTATAPVLTDKGNVSVGTWNLPANVPQPSPAPAKDVIDSSDGRLTQANAVVDPKTGASKPTIPDWYNVHQLTGSIGGPIVKNKTFFFTLFDDVIVRGRTIQNLQRESRRCVPGSSRGTWR